MDFLIIFLIYTKIVKLQINAINFIIKNSHLPIMCPECASYESLLVDNIVIHFLVCQPCAFIILFESYKSMELTGRLFLPNSIGELTEV